MQHIYVALLPLTYPLAIAEFHVSYTSLGIVLGIVGATGGLLQGAAIFYQRVSARLVLALQNLLLAANSVLLAVAPTYGVFGAGQFLGGVISSPQHPVGNAVLTRRFPERGGTVLGWHTTGGNVGTLVVPLIASLVIARWGWRAALVAGAVPLAMGGVLVALRLREGRSDPSGASGGGAGTSLRAAVLRRGTLIVIAAGTIAAGGRGLGAVNAFVPSYLRGGLGLPQVTVGLVFTVVLASSVAGPILAGRLADRYGRRQVAVAAYVVGGVGLGLFGMAGASIPALLALGVLVGAFAYAESPLLQALYADAVPDAPRQAAFGVYFAIAYGAGSIWVTILGWTIDRAGFSAAFWVMGASFLAAAAVLLLPGGAAGVSPAPPRTPPRPAPRPPPGPAP
ncbi:MAG TPA: MFS transporter [Candidatus Dormibacteraeota bacterium]